MVIGDSSAGANGNVSYLPLPGGSKYGFSALGIYYPNWGITQRKGVRIDIEVYPDMNSIKKGYDVWMEEAIKYIGEE